MSKLKIEHGASKVRWSVLKTPIEEQIAADIDLMCRWSENERKYVVNELLRFALAQAVEFQEYKTAQAAGLNGLQSGQIAPRPGAAGQSEPGIRKLPASADRAQTAAS